MGGFAFSLSLLPLCVFPIRRMFYFRSVFFPLFWEKYEYCDASLVALSWEHFMTAETGKAELPFCPVRFGICYRHGTLAGRVGR